MTTKEYEPVDWHGAYLHIDQDKEGFITISRPPFETVFNAEEGEEIKQFIEKYRPSLYGCNLNTISPTPNCFGQWQGLDSEKCKTCNIWGYCADLEARTAAIRNQTLDGLCNVDLTYYVWGDILGEDVRKCDGVSCNYCGRFNK